MSRHKDASWSVQDTPTIEGAQLAVLMDIRDEQNFKRRVQRAVARKMRNL